MRSPQTTAYLGTRALACWRVPGFPACHAAGTPSARHSELCSNSSGAVERTGRIFSVIAADTNSFLFVHDKEHEFRRRCKA